MQHGIPVPFGQGGGDCRLAGAVAALQDDDLIFRCHQLVELPGSRGDLVHVFSVVLCYVGAKTHRHGFCAPQYTGSSRKPESSRKFRLWFAGISGYEVNEVNEVNGTSGIMAKCGE